MVADVDDDDDRSATIAGHPLVRALRRDAAREVWVASDAAGGGVELHRSQPGGEAVLAREAEALLLADHPHLVPILDVATDAGVVLVRPLLPHDLAGWLLERGAPQPGEAVTALAPIAAAIGALHAAGASIGGLAAQQVRLDADGAPLLLGEGARVETSRPSLAWREGSPAVAADAAGWRALAETVLAASGVDLPAAVDRAIEGLDLAAAGDALLAAWPALPLVLEPPTPRASTGGGRVRHRERTAGARAGWARAVWARADAVWARADAVWARADGVRARAAALLEALAARVPRRLRERDGGPVRALHGVRPRFWALGAVGAVALVVALLLPSGTGAAGEDEPGAAPVASPQHGAASPAPSPVPAAPSAPATDDPVAGAAMLLAEREACLDAADAACLVGLHEPDSPQLGASQPWRMPADGRLELVQRLGDAWLLRVVSNAEPASVLIMSSEAGWVLRDAWPG